jgi:protein-disulfide isomerase
VSRGYNARRKAKRRQARVSAKQTPRAHRRWPRRWVTLAPALIIAVVLAAVGFLGLGASKVISKDQVDQEVTALLDGIPQRGTTLGSPKAPITLSVYADLECPTVKLFVENYLPSIIETWVRPGAVRLAYRSLETDTSNEEVFFKQEIAALAAARQDRMWNFVLTFVREQGEPQTSYVTDEFIDDIASQVPGLEGAQWHSERADARLSKRVALGVYSGHTKGLRSTPGFLIIPTKGAIAQQLDRAPLWKELEVSLRNVLKSLQKESSEDFPTLRTIGSGLLGG